jgi:hypothetical protein
MIRVAVGVGVGLGVVGDFEPQAADRQTRTITLTRRTKVIISLD